MKASEVKFQLIIEGTKQYAIPLFQRAYSWTGKEWNVLWEDLFYLMENAIPHNHFIGSIVTMPTTSVPEGVTKYLLIDGQQRLTTIFVLLTLIRDLSKEADENLASKINETMLMNPYEDGVDRYKLLPTQTDREAYSKLIRSEEYLSESRIGECYKFFARKIKQANCDLQTLSKVITSRLLVVSILLESDDNPYLVFESLNAKGRELTKADLIRNFFFMKIHVNEQQEMYGTYWDPMQRDLGEDLTECVRHFLMRKGQMVKHSDVYFALKESVAGRDAVEALAELATYAGHYGKLLRPEREEYADLGAALARLNRLEVSTAYPFLLNCYSDYSQGKLQRDEFAEVVEIIENYILRRFVCNVPTNPLNKYFADLCRQSRLSTSSSLLEVVRSALQAKSYPKDTEFQMRLKDSRVYGGGQRAAKSKFILESLESSFGHKEQVPFEDLTVEHVLPQMMTDWWRDHLGEDWEADQELLLHTLGNLTLTAYNSEASNDSFDEKKKIYSQSHLELNKYFGGVSSWKRMDVEERARCLAELALKVWPYFGSDDKASVGDDVTGKSPKVVTILGQHMTVINSWRDVLITTLETILELEPELFQKLVEEYPRFVNKEASHLRDARELSNGFFCEVNLSAKYVYKFCRQAIEAIELSVDDWKVEFR